ncbi:MAG TPA: CDC48 family AAA ATPase [Candidatus Methanomethylophilaceae archaeon]|nr:CDC48 family AAA ATPase [Candidatus Methanomethylophilaceae archaeon]
MADHLELKVGMARRQSETGYGRARMDTASRSTLDLEVGDAVEISGRNTVVAKVFKGDSEDEGRGLIRIDGLTRTSAGIGVDDTVTVRKCYPKPAEKITLAPNLPEGKKAKYSEGIESVFIKDLTGRPLVKGLDILLPNVALLGNRSTFSVISTVPQGPVSVTSETILILKDSPDNGRLVRNITYDDIGGLGGELKRIRELVELPLKHPELFERLGISAPSGVLMYGPSGTGKTLIAQAVANESGASFYPVQGPEIIGSYYGQSEGRLREIFREAAENAPSIVFLDEIDSIAPNRDSVSGEVEKRVVAQLLTLMDGMSDREGVIVIGATNREDSIDPALRRPGRFDREIEIGVPGRSARKEILDVHTRNMPLAKDVDIDVLASITQGFVGADLAALCREGAMQCLSSRMDELDLDKPIPPEKLADMKVSMQDFTNALADVEPSGMREVMVEIPKVTWADVGGLDDIKNEIREVFTPGESTKAFERLGITPGKGLLLYGPPGTGKTLMAKAVANESGVNFISVSGAEMASKWLGETEQAIRHIFKRAKQMSPCMIFFDELDSIAPRRGSGDSGTWERVVAQLLTAMDGIESMGNVSVMAATNRPDMIDPALLRPGRFDRLVLVGKPDLRSRLRILEIHSNKMPLVGVDLIDVAEETDGYIGADLEALCREAGLTAYREDDGAEFVNKSHFDKALKVVRPSVTPDTFKSYEVLGKEIKKRRDNWDGVPFYG